MKWRKVKTGDKWYRREVYRGRKNGVVYTIEPHNGGGCYVCAVTKAGEAENSLWLEHGARHFKNLEDAQAWAETWLQ